jgi:hypothetical protein
LEVCKKPQTWAQTSATHLIPEDHKVSLLNKRKKICLEAIAKAWSDLLRDLILRSAGARPGAPARMVRCTLNASVSECKYPPVAAQAAV